MMHLSTCEPKTVLTMQFDLKSPLNIWIGIWLLGFRTFRGLSEISYSEFKGLVLLKEGEKWNKNEVNLLKIEGS